MSNGMQDTEYEEAEPETFARTFEFSGSVWYWRGPSPYHFLTVPEAQSEALREIAPLVSYGWGMIPVQARIGNTKFTTSLFHKDGRYILPIKDSVRKAEDADEGAHVEAHIEVKVRAAGEAHRPACPDRQGR